MARSVIDSSWLSCRPHPPAGWAAGRTVACDQGANQGELVLDNNLPALSTDAHDHAGRGPRRSDPARAANPIASTASATGLPAGSDAVRFGSSRCAQARKWAATRAGADRKRRSQPRTVECRPAQPLGHPAMTHPGGPGRQRPSDHRHRVDPPQQGDIWQQHVRRAARAAPPRLGRTDTGPPPARPGHAATGAGRTPTGSAHLHTPGRRSRPAPSQSRLAPRRSLR